jgi:YD repeat-containing protein
MHLTTPASLSVNRTIDAHTDVTDPLGLITSLSYDSLGQLIGIQAPAVGGIRSEVRYSYDTNGNVLARPTQTATLPSALTTPTALPHRAGRNGQHHRAQVRRQE